MAPPLSSPHYSVATVNPPLTAARPLFLRGGVLHRCCKALANPRFFCVLLAWLMVLLVAGTVAQRYIGLYQAWQKYFASFVFFEGVVPLPGGYAALSALAFGLVMRLIFATNWRARNQAGVTIVHLGALLLLVGGGLTAAFSSEGNMVIREGRSSAVIHDYYDLELALSAAGRPSAVLPGARLRPGALLHAGDVPFTIEVLSFCRNCEIAPYQGQSQDAAAPRRGFARNFQLRPLPLDKQAENNRGGVGFRVRGSDSPGVYAVFESMPIAQTLSAGGRRYTASLRRRQTALPFRLHLVDFVRENHPGTDLARRYRSEVLLMEGGIETRKVIRMNEPLRHRGFTFYQASFLPPSADGDGVETTVLAVVRNSGRLFPYFSSILICFGLLLHLAQRIPRLIKRSA